MRTIEETIEWLIALINPLSVNRCQPPTQEVLRLTINQNRDSYGRAYRKWDKEFQQDVMKLDLDIIKFFYRGGFMDKEILSKEGRNEVKLWVKNE